ncbi:unnamed protein product [Ilex paraguariensis]|uniref:DAGKc domain-containing protein n=1 Tax=Ilex paraguariensis TaxID=185542 RepID=A0ABC8U6D8_9AQUA
MFCCGIAVVAKAKPSFIRAEQPLVPDLSTERGVYGGGAPIRRRDIVFVVNPRGANRRTGKELKKLVRCLRYSLGLIAIEMWNYPG